MYCSIDTVWQPDCWWSPGGVWGLTCTCTCTQGLTVSRYIDTHHPSFKPGLILFQHYLHVLMMFTGIFTFSAIWNSHFEVNIGFLFSVISISYWETLSMLFEPLWLNPFQFRRQNIGRKSERKDGSSGQTYWSASHTWLLFNHLSSFLWRTVVTTSQPLLWPWDCREKQNKRCEPEGLDCAYIYIFLCEADNRSRVWTPTADGWEWCAGGGGSGWNDQAESRARSWRCVKG